MKKYLKLIALVGILSPMTIPAQVDEAQIIPFVAGTPARAADMNQNIQALIAAINSNTDQIKALQQQMSIIASVTNLPQPTLQQNLTGSVYRIGFLSAESGTGIDKTRQKIFGSNVTLTLNADGTLDLSTVEQERELNLYFRIDADVVDGITVKNVADLTIDKLDTPINENIDGTWSLAGNTLTLDLGGNPEVFFVSTDGNMLFKSGHDNYADQGFNMFAAHIATGVRVHKPTPNILVRFYELGAPSVVAVNNGEPYHLVGGTPTEYQNIYIKNTGDADLVLGSRALIHTQGEGISIPAQIGSVTIAPNQEIIIPVSDDYKPIFPEPADLASVYLMSNDPDTPTFIVNIKSERVTDGN